MASSKLSYYRLGKEGGLLDEESQEVEVIRAFGKIRGRFKIKRLVGWRRRPKVVILGLRRLQRKRRIFMRLRASWSKALERLKNGQAHMSDLFAGNYLFMQVNSSTPFMGHGRKTPLPRSSH
ncbi:uncharacterized protein LOC133876063 [Alnus glutinosa]|uniref:uncharacterized protein LOC133876063 n=1 Tax=Alnus glutinosa TaxID=3517 RepID=UPI002D769AEC|nr:uncharacterized protein LOC133876063 [Alnus glutinosa]